MNVKTIKNVDEETWYKFRKLAVKNRVHMGVLLKNMINKFENESGKFWKSILEEEKILTDSEAKELLNHVKELRKEHGFRE